MAGVLAAATLSSPGAAAGSAFVTFGEFLSDVSRTTYSVAAATGRAGLARDAAAFEQMRQHTLELYRGVQVEHSYLSHEGYFDCVTIDSQPGVRAMGGKAIAAPPQPSTKQAKAPGEAFEAVSELALGLKDGFGNAISCGKGTIPMHRVTLERMTKFADLRGFLSKGLKTPKTGASTTADPYVHRHAVGLQMVPNHGGQSALALYSPAGEFSLSQHWYLNGEGASMQSVEGGWVKYLYGWGDRSVTFIFHTADGYSTGCYNLECAGFVQTNPNWALGGGWSVYSTPGGPQYQFTMQWQWYQGNWWMFLQGAGAMEAVGYYPGYIYRGGPMTYYANRSDFGGETARMFTNFAQMGSGYHAAHGWGWAAYQHSVFYIVNGVGTWSSLTPGAAPGCYSIAYTPASAGWNWGTFFYYGGPGGDVC